MTEKSNHDLQQLKIKELESRLEESEQLVEAIRAGEVDAFAINNANESIIYTLQSGDYAYRILIEEFGEGAINVTEEGLIVYTNPYFFELLQLSYEKVIGNSIFDFIHPDSKNEFNRLFNESLIGKSKGEINLAVNDTIIPVYVSLTSLQPNLSTIGIIITDFSEKKKNENTILEYQKELESKNALLEEMNKELQSFAYISSHDLQEPLRKIQTFASRISEKELQNLSENGQLLFSKMQISAKRMQTLIEDLLAYSRTNNQDRKFELAHIDKIIEEVKEDLMEDLKDIKATIESNVKCKTYIITFQFHQLLHNLISNSIKFSKPEAPLLVTIESQTAKGIALQNDKLSPHTQYCHITYTDNGIGFEPEYNEKIFELFQRLHSKHEYDGTGIGLAIVKKIVDNHNGVITAYGKSNMGATFNIYIPRF